MRCCDAAEPYHAAAAILALAGTLAGLYSGDTPGSLAAFP